MIEPKDKKNKMIYKAIDLSFINVDKYIKNTYYARYKKDSQNSFTFSVNKEKNQPEANEDKLKIIEDVFELKDNRNIRNKYNQAINGSGQEWKRISVLTSSSLCAFLHFYNLNNKPININGVIYDDVYFEVQNKVLENHQPSNVDIVLISNKSKKLLFLESKFSEYLTIEKSKKISKDYKNIYDELNIKDKYKLSEEDGMFIISSKDNNKRHYFEGIKQMISHYIGVKNFIKDNKSIDNKIILKYGFEVELGTILFDGWKNTEFLKDYSKEYKQLVNQLNTDKNKPNNLKILDSILTYQDIFKDYNLDEKVKKYYRY